MIPLYFRVLDCDIEVCCGDRDTSDIVCACYSAFLQPDGHRRSSGSDTLAYRIARSEDADSWSLQAGDTAIECRGHAELLYHLEKHMTISIQRIRNELLFVHGAVVTQGNRCNIISGASGAGKSTLCWALCHEGFGYLSDELAPVRLMDSHVEAYPHALCLKGKPDERYPLPAGVIDAGATLHVPVDQIPARTGRFPVPLGSIVFLTGEDDDRRKPAITRIEPGEAAARLYANSLNQLAHPRQGLAAVANLAQSTPCYTIGRGPIAESTRLLCSLFAGAQQANVAERSFGLSTARGLA